MATVVSPRRRGKRARALENPLTGGEMVIIAVTGLAGIGSGDLVDRFIATHAFTVNASQGGSMDSPAIGQVYNYQAVAAPMNWKRWLAGAGGTFVPLAVAAWVVKGPGWRAGFQGVGIGWGLGTLNRGLRDLMTMLLGKTAFGMRMYADEISAANAAKTASTATAVSASVVPVSLAGVRRGTRLGTHVAGCGCSSCNSTTTTTPPANPPAGTSGAPRNVAAPPQHVAPSAENPAPTHVAGVPENALPPAGTGGWRARMQTSIPVASR